LINVKTVVYLIATVK